MQKSFYCFKINLILVLSFKLRTKIAEVEKHIVLLVHLKFRHFQSLSEVQFKNAFIIDLISLTEYWLVDFLLFV